MIRGLNVRGGVNEVTYHVWKIVRERLGVDPNIENVLCTGGGGRW